MNENRSQVVGYVAPRGALIPGSPVGDQKSIGATRCHFTCARFLMPLLLCTSASLHFCSIAIATFIVSRPAISSPAKREMSHLGSLIGAGRARATREAEKKRKVEGSAAAAEPQPSAEVFTNRWNRSIISDRDV